jgi:protocatechuate 3,4-dioxygenase beta subunit
MQRSASVLAFLLLAPGFAWTQMMTMPAISLSGQADQISAPQPNVPPEQRCVVAGRVTNSLTSEPVKKATIRLSANRAEGGMRGLPLMTLLQSGGQGYSTSTDSDGSFRIEGVNPGQYLLWVNRTGFLNTSYGSKRPAQAGSAITLSPGQQLTNLAVAMTPQSVINGKVLDADGDPVPGGIVQALAPMWMRGKLRYTPRGSGQINDLGEYRIPNLPPGKYFVFAQMHNNTPAGEVITGKPDIRPVRTYYPSSIAFAGASPVEVTAGQDASGIDVRIQSVQTYHIRGRVSGLASNNAHERSVVNLTPRDDAFMVFNAQSSLLPDGSFDIAGVAPGAYYLNMFSMAGRIRNYARQEIDVGTGDVDGVVLTVTPPGSIKGVARLEGTPPANSPQVSASSLHVNLMPAEMTGMMGGPANAKFSADGTFTVENVSPGKFYVQTNAPPGTYLKSIRFGNAEILGKELDLSGGAAGQLDLVYRYGPGEIDGQVDSTQNGTTDTASATTQIVVVPEELHADGSGVRFASLDAKGNFKLPNLPPGRYRAYALEEVNYNALQNPDLLKQLETMSPAFEVKEKENKQVQLHLILQNELDQLYARLGIQP